MTKKQQTRQPNRLGLGREQESEATAEARWHVASERGVRVPAKSKAFRDFLRKIGA